MCGASGGLRLQWAGLGGTADEQRVDEAGAAVLLA